MKQQKKWLRRALGILLSLAMLMAEEAEGSIMQAAAAYGAAPMSEGTSGMEYGISNPTTDSDGVTTWDCIYFGNYWKNDTDGDGGADKEDEKEPIKWRVLSVNGDDAFLLADPESGL